MINTGTRYGECVITVASSGDETWSLFALHWFYVHVGLPYLSTDHEFGRPTFRKYSRMHGIVLNAQPSRYANTCGLVERNNGAFPSVFDRLQRANTGARARVLVAWSSFTTDVFRGSQLQSAFQLARGYWLSGWGISSRIVSPERFDTQTERENMRELQMVPKDNCRRLIDPTQFPPNQSGVFLQIIDTESGE